MTTIPTFESTTRTSLAQASELTGPTSSMSSSTCVNSTPMRQAMSIQRAM